MGEILKTVHSILESLQKLDAKLYDEENPEWYISSVYYNAELDKYMFICKEECKDD